ncbi:MAG: alkane 1-monooxygenase [Flavobacteriales bacterium]|nr:alkane 1-monooxygenase [Flavobacteriales bacterium]
MAFFGVVGDGLVCWAFPLFGFALVPMVELFLEPRHRVLSEMEEEAALQDPLFDLLLYAFVPLQWFILFRFLAHVDDPGITIWDLSGRIATMGMMCGIYGINVAHELGHRRLRWERDLARTLLLSSLYMHFIIEHNRGHHARVATPDDPASARKNEALYTFWFRSVVFSFISAWRIEVERSKKEGRAPYGLGNEMLRSLTIEASLLVGIAFFFGSMALWCFMAAAMIGILLLETVNYIEHYGLRRRKNDYGQYQRVQHVHSWNSDLLPGRLMLFELTRHSDHHYKASKKYQVLRSHEVGPQLPTGYPGMMLLSLVPPLWFRVVNPIIERLRKSHAELDVAQ